MGGQVHVLVHAQTCGWREFCLWRVGCYGGAEDNIVTKFASCMAPGMYPVTWGGAARPPEQGGYGGAARPPVTANAPKKRTNERTNGWAHCTAGNERMNERTDVRASR